MSFFCRFTDIIDMEIMLKLSLLQNVPSCGELCHLQLTFFLVTSAIIVFIIITS
jgi:hypothetical protein